MTTIRDEFTTIKLSNVVSGRQPHDVGDILNRLGIDPDLPAEWATVDRCLTWLRGQDYPPRIDLEYGFAWVTIFDGFGDAQNSFRGPTLHAALIAACKAVQEQP